MIKKRKSWVFKPPKPTKLIIPEILKTEVEVKATELTNTVLKPTHIKPPLENPEFNYITDIYTKWYSSYFYFCATYAVAGPNALAPSFESKFARLEYIGEQQFNLSYMRYTGEWWPIGQGLPLDQCLTAIKDGGVFVP